MSSFPCLGIQVRKAAYQSLGILISTFYISNGNQTPENNEEDSSLGPLSDSLLQDNSLLENITHSGGITTGTGSSGGAESETTTTDLSSDNRHPLPDNPQPNSSTPIHPSSGASSSELEVMIQDHKFSNFEFWRSPIPNLVEEGERNGTDVVAAVNNSNSKGNCGFMRYVNILEVSSIDLVFFFFLNNFL